MKKLHYLVLSLILVACTATFSMAADVSCSWNKGLTFKTDDDQFKIGMGGRLMVDWMFASEDSEIKDVLGKSENGTEVRRAWLRLNGSIYENVDFLWIFGFQGGDTSLLDGWFGITFDWVKVRVGHIKEPFSLEYLTSSKYITFMERGLTTAMTPGYNSGINFKGNLFDKAMLWEIGAYTETDSWGKGQSDTYSITGRITGLPYENEGDLLHLGVAYSYRDFDKDDDVRYRERPEAHLANYYVDTTGFKAQSTNLVGLELLGIYGSFSLQGEYIMSDLKSDTVSNPNVNSYYIYASYFLTGEQRPYSKTSGVLGCVSPNENFLAGSGIGAWELGARYSAIDLNNKGLTGGKLADVTVGLNWYLNPNTRIMFNYVYADQDDLEGKANIFMTRFQLFI